ncbi:hypothetical protein D2E51_17720 [Mycobacteroides abscessus]|uniref:Uncharacterized protein n=1 Tax=Mycobacteroides abscessus TaxID=36809 RepID=A0AB33TCC0_9MYCO|nr:MULTISPECIES: hypothetical protein [Mycobacteroides]RIS93686.1 hypothetical protein D2E51_17720 [Mycobacteroides abscessus]CPT67177.1 Uncharacterised protein [Mycobacteroides abscessus]CPT76913.1 Uncharacterised protein [Mycobacteroides abscessus]CPV17508.1 Uncharacterised protein [Mycobacteroides abscessus]CPW63827.1 Uncharacterised protein [Mycobacteroides abscessus]
MTGQRVGVVIDGVVYIDHVSGKKYSGVHAFGGLTPDLEPPACPAPGQDPVARAHRRITELYDTVRYLTAPRWKRPLLRILRWFR